MREKAAGGRDNRFPARARKPRVGEIVNDLRPRITHEENIAKKRDTGEFETHDPAALTGEAMDNGRRAVRLAGVHRGPDDEHERRKNGRQRKRSERSRGHRRGHTLAAAEVGKVEHLAKNLDLEGRADRRVPRKTLADDAAQIEESQPRARRDRLGHTPFVAVERPPLAEGADDDVALLHETRAAVDIL
jgi:hypothetical protein